MLLNQQEVASLGASLRVIEPQILKSSHKKDTMRVWLQGGEPYFDIFFELKNHEIIWFQFTLRGRYLSWYHGNGKVQTGSTNELSINDVNFYPASKILENDYVCDVEFVNLVKEIFKTRNNEELFSKALQLLPG
ncbi:MAG: hypothetical protein F6K62_23990 [Sphaerospermopsis sp. SIO1G2]|nr:hypothetical protein [Sphaerospermopsis sp. SIO1G1]NET73885.1 hypothetical protein [Sphaerospermopsis sp. SIO1G2]